MPANQTGRWKHLYDRSTWRRRAKLQLKQHPLCVMCEARGILTAAEICDHVIAHRGDEWLFYNGELQSLCGPCHNSRKKQQETHGYQRDVGADGWPIDPNHPANKPRPLKNSN